MSQSCPLCGKIKPEEALFCDDCTKKIHTEYEVDIPEEINKEDIPPIQDLPAKGKPGDRLVDSRLRQEEAVNQDEAGFNDRVEGQENEQEVKPQTEVNELKTVSGVNPEEKKRGPEPESEPELGTEPEKTALKKRKRMGTPVLFILVVALLTGAFFVYNATIRKGNLDRSSWDAAVKENSVEGYLAYMEVHPRGVHFDEAQAGLLRLKSEEAMSWKRMKETDNVTELRDFLERHPGSPYTPLVKTRLDSLIWIGTLQTNTAESYSDYIMLAENGGIKGDYIAEARKRYTLLFSSQSADVAVMDSIRTTIDGFFISLSSLNHSGMFRYLAPAVHRFFDSGAATRERITGELLVTGAQTEGATLQFVPDLETVRYEVTNNNHYKVNVSLQKTYSKNGVTERIHGYIVHMELDPLFQIVSIFETKPYPEAP